MGRNHKKFHLTLNKPFVIGIGTGRCGTFSLTQLLDMQEGWSVQHEGYRYMPYFPVSNNLNITIAAINATAADTCGDVGWYWLLYCERMITMFDCKVIWLQRDLDEVTESFWSIKKDADKYVIVPEGVKPFWQYPFMNYDISKEAIRHTVTVYDYGAKALHENFQESVYALPMESLNDEDALSDLLTWLGIPADDQRIEIFHSNKGEDIGKQTQIEMEVMAKAAKWRREEELREGLGATDESESNIKQIVI